MRDRREPRAGLTPDRVRLHPLLEGKPTVRTDTITIGGKPTEQLIREMRQKRINIDQVAISMMESSRFTVSEVPTEIGLVSLKVGDLGVKKAGPLATMDEIYERAEELGLELVPAEVGPHYALLSIDQPMIDGEVDIGMNPINTVHGPSLFYYNSTWEIFGSSSAHPYGGSLDSEKFVFGVRK